MGLPDEAPESRHVRTLLAGWDPLGVGELGLEFQPDLYDALIDPLIHRLGCGATGAELVQFLTHEVRDEYGKDPDEARIGEFAHELLAWHTGAFHR